MRIVAINRDKNGTDIITLQDEEGRLTHELEKNVPKELLLEYNGEIFNRKDNKNI